MKNFRFIAALLLLVAFCCAPVLGSTDTSVILTGDVVQSASLFAGAAPSEAVFQWVHLLGQCLGLAVVAVIGAILRKKFGIELDDKTNDRLERFASRAVHAVEERAADVLKRGGARVDSSQKLQWAVEHLFPIARKALPGFTEQQAKELIHSTLLKTLEMGAKPGFGA